MTNTSVEFNTEVNPTVEAKKKTASEYIIETLKYLAESTFWLVTRPFVFCGNILAMIWNGLKTAYNYCFGSNKEKVAQELPIGEAIEVVKGVGEQLDALGEKLDALGEEVANKEAGVGEKLDALGEEVANKEADEEVNDNAYRLLGKQLISSVGQFLPNKATLMLLVYYGADALVKLVSTYGQGGSLPLDTSSFNQSLDLSNSTHSFFPMHNQNGAFGMCDLNSSNPLNLF